MVYEYSAKNGFKHPQFYMYTPYNGREFLKIFKNYRKKIILALEHKDLGYKTKHSFDKKNGSILEVLLKNCPKNTKLINKIETNKMLKYALFIVSTKKIRDKKNIYFIINKLIHKYEVTKKIYNFYNKNFKKLSCNFKNIENYALLSLICLICYRKESNLKYLNCSLKLNDLLCSVAKKNNNRNDIALVLAALNQELVAIDCLNNQF